MIILKWILPLPFASWPIDVFHYTHASLEACAVVVATHQVQSPSDSQEDGFVKQLGTRRERLSQNKIGSAL